MSVQRVRWWQWVVLSLVVGAVFAWVWVDTSADLVSPPGRGRDWFISELRRKTETGEPTLRDIVVEPLKTNVLGEPVQRVRFKVFARNIKTEKWEQMEDGSMIVPVPFIAAAPHQDYRVADWLKEQKEKNPAIDYTYAWWQVSGMLPDNMEGETLQKFFQRPADKKPWFWQKSDDRSLYFWERPYDRELHFWQKPANAWLTAMGASVLLIGVTWPMVIRMLVRMGFGVPEDELGVDLSKVKSSARPEPVRAGVTDADLSDLDSLNARLEANVAGMLMSQDELDDAEERRAEEAVVRKLEAQRLESQQANAKPEEPKDYKGEFYPVARPAGKKDDH